MLTAEYEQSYISTFTKIFTVLKNEYDLYVKPGECENYEIEVKSVNNEDIKEYLSICFQKQNGAFTIISSNNINPEILEKLSKDISIAINLNPIAKYNFKDLRDYTIYHFEYVIENKIVDNKLIIEQMNMLGQIENVNYDITFNPFSM